MVLEAVDHRVYEGFFLEEAIPFWVVKICGDNCGFFLIPQLHEPEESVDLLGFEGEVAKFIDLEEIVIGKGLHEPGSGSVCKGCVDLVQQVLGVEEAASVAREDGLPHEALWQGPSSRFQALL